MLTISQLAAYAGVTVRAVRHYHQIGLLPEPGRDRSGYRTYGAAAVVQLIRIHTLAAAGVPLARVQELLDAGSKEFADGLQEIDKDLRVEIRRLQDTRRRLARLATAEHPGGARGAGGGQPRAGDRCALQPRRHGCTCVPVALRRQAARRGRLLGSRPEEILGGGGHDQEIQDAGIAACERRPELRTCGEANGCIMHGSDFGSCEMHHCTDG